MPEMSGAELLAAVRGQGEKWAQVVFVFVTGLSDRRDRYAMLPLKPDDYFCKPIDFVEADRKLAAILQKRRGTAAP
jgi:DNA-binding response OmpR family regulator